MNTKSRVGGLALAALFAASCARSEEMPEVEGVTLEGEDVEQSEAGVSVSGNRYVARPVQGRNGVSIDHRFTNGTASVVYLVNCNGSFSVTLEEEINGEWSAAYSPPLPACLSPAIEIAPGATHQGTLVVPVAEVPVDQAEGVDPGTYRLNWASLHTSWNPAGPFGELIPEADRTSAPFEISVAP